MNAVVKPLLLVLIAMSLCACATVKPIAPVEEAKVGVDTAVAAVKVSQAKAAKQAAVLVAATKDPIVKQEAVALQETISDLGSRLDTATGKIAWYEDQYATLYAHDADQTVIAQKEEAKAQEKAVEAHNNAKERDVILYLFAVLASAYVGTFFAGPVMREFPTPWNVMAAAIAYLATGLGAYSLGRLMLAGLAHLIP